MKKYFTIDNDIFSSYFKKYFDLVQSNQRKTPFNISEYLVGVAEKEIERMTYFALTYAQKTMIVKVPNEKDKLEEFLGYSFSERNGEEGIKVAKIDDVFQSTLYDETNLDNTDKLNYYIKSHLNGKATLSISENVSEYISIKSLWSIIDFDKGNWIKEFYTNKKSNIIFETTKYSYEKLANLLTVKTGKSSYTKEYANKNVGNYPLLTGELIFNKDEYVKVLEQSSDDIVNPDTISVNKDNAAGSRCFYRDFPYVMNSHHLALVPNANNGLNLKYAQILFDNYLKNNHFGWDGAVLGSDEILGLKLPLPSLTVQNKIVNDVMKIEN